MATTRDYMDYLDDAIGIAPANSQEEFQAAETIVDIMKDHGVEPTIQEFDSRPLGRLMPYILMLVMFVGMPLSGLGGGLLRGLGFLLVVVPAVCLIIVHSGNDIFENFGPASRSQNVIGVHKASGPKVTKGSRPVVIVAHYDTPRESVLYGRQARYQVPLRKASVLCVAIDLVAALVQILGFLPGGLRTIVWIVGLVASIPLLILAIAEIAENFSSCTAGSNDNKSSVAALLAVMSKVAPAKDAVDDRAGTDVSAVEPEPDAAPAVMQNDATPHETRHGKEVLEELGILPDTCEIVYEDAAPAQAAPTLEEEFVTPATEVEGGEAQGAGQYDMPQQEEEANDEEVWPSVQDEEDDTQAQQTVDDAPQEVPPQDDAVAPELSGDDSYADYPEEEWEPAPQKESFGTKVSRGFNRLRDAFRKRKDSDISIPRGDGEDVDFTEFEETNWGDEPATPAPQQDELLPITRDEMHAIRTTETQDEPEESPWDGGSASEAGEAADEASVTDDTDVVDDIEESHEPYAGESVPDEGTGDTAVGAIDHEEGSDWSLVEDGEGEDEDVPPQSAGYDAAEYQRSEESYEYSDDGDDDLAAVEDQLEADQLASGKQPPRRSEQNEESEGEEEPDDGLSWDAVDDAEDEFGDELERTLTTTREPRKKHHGLGDKVRNALSLHQQDQPQDEEPESQGEPPFDPYDDETADSDATDETSSEHVDADSHHDAGDADDSGILPKDTSGLDTMTDSLDDYDSESGLQDDQDAPDPIDDPSWGQSSFVPPKPKVNVARRAALFDLPDPSEETEDPLADESQDASEKDSTTSTRGWVSEVREIEEGDSDDFSDLDDPTGEGTPWKGGAAVRSDLLETDEDVDDPDGGETDWEGDAEEVDVTPEVGEETAEADVDDTPIVIDQDDLQDAILSMGDDDLLAHDIWFVAVGSSSVKHAGIKAFLSNFRQDIRGAFLINLDSIGAGTPTLLTTEGLHAGRRSDRRIVRLLSTVADDLHVPLQKASYDWADTDATPAMRSRVRAVTLMGTDENGLPALSHTQDDIPANVSPEQVSAVVRVVTEAIRRA